MRCLLQVIRWHWWTDATVIPEAALLLRSLGWLLQLWRSDPAAFTGQTFLHVLAFSSKTFWTALLTVVLALVICSYQSRALPLRIVGALAYIFWYAFVVYILLRLANTSLSIPDAFVSGLIAFWLLLRLARRVGIKHAIEIGGHA